MVATLESPTDLVKPESAKTDGFSKSDKAVQGTNDSSILSKASMAALGYFDDPFLSMFISRSCRRAPLINIGYYIRAKAIDHTLRTFLKSTSSPCQIVSLGAGFDTSYFRLKKLGMLDDCKFVEVDFPDVARRKRGLIQQNSQLQELLGPCTVTDPNLIGKDYSLLGCDLTNLGSFQNLLTEKLPSLDAPTLCFAECVLTYVDYQMSLRLINKINEMFSSCIFVTYEQSYPSDSFAQVMLSHFNKLQSPLQRIHKLNSIDAHTNIFLQNNWDSACGMDMNFFYHNYLDMEEKLRISSIEPFDEYEEWHLKCSHYCVIAAFKGNCTNLEKLIFPKEQCLHQDSLKCTNQAQLVPVSRPSQQLQRIGHTCTPLGGNSYLIYGGFGAHGKQHCRLSNGFVIDLNNVMLTKDYEQSGPVIKSEFIFPASRMHHTMNVIGENTFFIFGGRTSPTKPSLEYGLLVFENETLRWENKMELVKNVTADLATNQGDDQTRELPSVRWRHASVRADDNIFIVGGKNEVHASLNDIWSYNIKDHRWSKVKCKGDFKGRHSHSVNLMDDGRFVVYGGLDSDMVALNVLQLLTFKDGEISVENISFADPLPARYSHASCIHDNKLIILGGIDPSLHYQPPLLVVDICDMTWRAAKILVSTSPLVMLHNHRVAWLDNGKAVLIGGGGNCFSFGTHFNAELNLITFDVEKIMEDG